MAARAAHPRQTKETLVEGQSFGIDRGSLTWISRENSQVISFDVPWRDVADSGAPAGTVRGPGEFQVA